MTKTKISFVDINSGFGKQKGRGDAGFKNILKRKKASNVVSVSMMMLRDMRNSLNKQTRAVKRNTKTLFLSRRRSYAIITHDATILGYIAVKRVTPFLVEVCDFVLKPVAEKLDVKIEDIFIELEGLISGDNEFGKMMFYVNTKSDTMIDSLKKSKWKKEATLKSHFLPGSDVFVYSKMI